jgi:hypothetical protein
MERGRLVPSGAVTVTQLVQLLERAGLPPVTYNLMKLPDDERAESVACRYLDSGMPVIAAGGGHVFALVGYRWVRDERSRKRIQFIRQDDLVGPYEIVENLPFDQYSPWEYLVIPLPTKVYMSGERAEKLGRQKLFEALEESDDERSTDLQRRATGQGASLAFRSSVHRSNEFKQKMRDRGNDDLLAAYQWLPLSRWVWVVELVDEERWFRNEPSVVAEVVIDATGHAENEQALAWRIPGMVGWALADFASHDAAVVEAEAYLPSVVDTNTTVVDLQQM